MASISLISSGVYIVFSAFQSALSIKHIVKEGILSSPLNVQNSPFREEIPTVSSSESNNYPRLVGLANYARDEAKKLFPDEVSEKIKLVVTTEETDFRAIGSSLFSSKNEIGILIPAHLVTGDSAWSTEDCKFFILRELKNLKNNKTLWLHTINIISYLAGIIFTAVWIFFPPTALFALIASIIWVASALIIGISTPKIQNHLANKYALETLKKDDTNKNISNQDFYQKIATIFEKKHRSALTYYESLSYGFRAGVQKLWYVKHPNTSLPPPSQVQKVIDRRNRWRREVNEPIRTRENSIENVFNRCIKALKQNKNRDETKLALLTNSFTRDIFLEKKRLEVREAFEAEIPKIELSIKKNPTQVSERSTVNDAAQKICMEQNFISEQELLNSEQELLNIDSYIKNLFEQEHARRIFYETSKLEKALQRKKTTVTPTAFDKLSKDIFAPSRAVKEFLEGDFFTQKLEAVQNGVLDQNEANSLLSLAKKQLKDPQNAKTTEGFICHNIREIFNQEFIDKTQETLTAFDGFLKLNYPKFNYPAPDFDT